MQATAVCAKQFQSVYSTIPVAITMVCFPVIFCCCLHFTN